MRPVALAITPVLLGLPICLVRAQEATNTEYLKDLPPLVERELFFGDPEMAGAQLSPDGRFIAFRKPYRDVMNIWIKGVDEPFETARPVTAERERPVRRYFWSEDSRYLLYVQDRGGNENYHVYAVDPTGARVATSGVPMARDLTPYEAVQARIYGVPESTPGRIVVGLNDRDPRVHDVYRLEIESGRRELVRENESGVVDWTLDLVGNVRLATRLGDAGETRMFRVEPDSLAEIYTCGHQETCRALRFHVDGRRAYLISNKGEGVDLTRLMLLDVETGEVELVESDPEEKVDFGGAWFSDATDSLTATYYVGQRLRVYPQGDMVERDLTLLRTELPEGEIWLGSSTDDERLVLVAVERDVDPGAVYLYDRNGSTVSLLYRSRPDLPSQHLAMMTPISYTARDGREISAYLTIPRGADPRNLPLVVMPHGGPWSRDVWGYDPFVQFLANRGYAVLQPNFRGSTGFGKAFLNAGDGEWGTGVMQHDITDGVEHLIRDGVVDRNRVGIFGGSYGGYATLAGLAFTPELYAAGISYVGPSNLITLLKSIPPYWVPAKRMFDLRVGDPDDPQDVQRLRSQSPLFSAERIKAPLLVIQGANDPRVKRAESEQIVVALRDLGREVDYILAEDEGHGFAREENRLAVATAIERFFAHHLFGRYQKEISEEVAARLSDLTVDVMKVTVSEPSGTSDSSRLQP